MASKAWLLLALLGTKTVPAAGQGEEDNFDDMADDEADTLSEAQLHGLHAKFDGNGDGKISLHEVLHYSKQVGREIASKDIRAILEEIDINKDGKLSLEEHMADIENQADGGDAEEQAELKQRQVLEEAKFNAADLNKDKMLDLNELPALFYPETQEAVLDVTVQDTMRQKDANKDGKLSSQEFWEADPGDGDDGELSEEEKQDFQQLDLDHDGFLNLQELRSWESGHFHTETAMKKLFEVADTNNDMHVSKDEMMGARENIAATDAQYHLIEWADHHEL